MVQKEYQAVCKKKTTGSTTPDVLPVSIWYAVLKIEAVLIYKPMMRGWSD